MAFQQPTPQTMQRLARSAAGDHDDVSGLVAVHPPEPQSDLSRTWVLFSPPTELTATSYLSETERSEQTLGRSRVSDLGSLNTEARTGPASAIEHTDESQAAVLSIAEVSAAEDAELDSLDGHLPGFRSLPSRSQHIFPSHDGLGSFRLEQPILSSEAQDHIYQFERFNPRRTRRRLNSFEQALEVEDAQVVKEADKRERIEAWRLEHSRILLEEIQRETRHRQRSKASSWRVQQPRQADVAAEADSENTDWHDQELSGDEDETHPGSSLSFLETVTRRALRDLLGIDGRLLSMLLGETVPGDEDLTRRSPMAPHTGDEQPGSEDTWQLRVLEKISSELGLLVNQLSKHPGAFSTYSRMQHMPLPYAGLPVIPESADGRATPKSSGASRSWSRSRSGGEMSDTPEFRPTVLASAQGVAMASRRRSKSRSAESGDTAVRDSSLDMDKGNHNHSFTQEEWERDLDIKLVFRYVVSRFTSRSESLASADTPRHNHNIAKPQDTAVKAARVRQHHPLISRSRPAERRSFKATAGPSSPVALRHHSSCASQSTRRSARRSSCSSRHYWDIGGSIKTSSVLASNAASGSWGEV